MTGTNSTAKMRVTIFSLIVCSLSVIGCARYHPHKIAPDTPLGAYLNSLPQLPGKKADGSVLLPNQWSLRPAGKQIELRDFPVNIAVHPRGRFAAVLHSGYSAHLVAIVDLQLGKIVSHVPISQSF